MNVRTYIKAEESGRGDRAATATTNATTAKQFTTKANGDAPMPAGARTNPYATLKFDPVNVKGMSLSKTFKAGGSLITSA